MFTALLIEGSEADRKVGLAELEVARLPSGDVEIDVAYSSLNYKDALAITGRSSVIRQWPMIPGVDLAGTISASASPDWRVGDAVVLNGWGIGESRWGGLSQKARVDAGGLTPLPAGMTPRQAMMMGTAGYTAALCLNALEARGLAPDQGEVLVTGATGGVGSIAILLLARAGYSVAAATGKASEADYLLGLGASTIIDRAELSAPGKPLQKERWAGVIDSVGSHTLINACAQIRYGGAAAACGMAQGMDLSGSVAPFILRGVALLGIDSNLASRPVRSAAWERLGRDIDLEALEAVGAREIGLKDAIVAADDLLDGKVRGRIVVDVNKQA